MPENQITLHFETADIPQLWVEDQYTIHFKYDARHWLLHIRNGDDPAVTLYIVKNDTKQTVKSVILNGLPPVDVTRYLRPKRHTDPSQEEREVGKSVFELIDWGHFIMTLVLDGLASVSDKLVEEQHWEDLLPSETISGITRKRHDQIDAILERSLEKFKNGTLEIAGPARELISNLRKKLETNG